MALYEYVNSLRVPWWCSEGRFDQRIRLGHVSGLETLRQLAAITDWGEKPKSEFWPHRSRHEKERWDRLVAQDERERVERERNPHGGAT